MARPSPSILFTDGDFEVFATSAVFVVCYRGQPIGTRQRKASGDFHYAKTTFPHRGHANRLANRLNEQFETDEFTVTTMLSLL